MGAVTYRKHIIVSSALITCAMAVTVVVYAIGVPKIKGLRQNISENRADVKAFAAATDFDEFVRFKAEYEKHLPLMRALEGAFIKEDEAFKIISWVTDAIAATLNQGSFGFERNFASPSDIGGGLKTIPFSATLDGNRETLTQFLMELHRLPFFLSVHSVALNSSDIFREGSQMRIRGEVYVR
ncbi:MAG: hypothetical protein A2939_03545 [Parcubacteria group bacterium RIFCSPLOWO2_01_FULL_48_18]|nr:MAG: hypothetical protein A2939_03545 [Parcubacteria group bacterium RIFCSPLOWO2_01_FULL_48_18]OHB23124.1 MAG: hypothetical protein A3J67_03165 [Parcubacteria group bacterium RIFCSPHIGHO2_02_FULL_48_10b]